MGMMGQFDSIMSNYTSINQPTQPKTEITVAQAQNGPWLPPIQRLFLYSASEWEAFTTEWAYYDLKASGNYIDLVRFGGADDHGVDIAGFVDDKGFEGVWDGYQCKHYKNPLAPADAKLEIGKILWHSFCKVYTIPRRYEFVAPKGIGTKLNGLLKNQTALHTDIVGTWKTVCRNSISSSGAIELEGDFLTYVNAFDFSIFGAVQPLDVIEGHRKSPYFISRFGGGFPGRPSVAPPPSDLKPNESRYVGHLLDAYAQHTKTSIPTPDVLKQWPLLKGHFDRQREAFYHAESLRVFVRDKVEPGTFEALQDEIFDGVINVQEASHVDGFACLNAVQIAAQELQLSANPIAPIAKVKDRHGVCHQLTNEDRLKWAK